MSLNIGYPAPAIQLSTVAIANDLGIFAKYGLDVTLSTVHATAAVSGLEKGSLQFVAGQGESNLLVASAASPGLVAIGWNAPKGSPFFLMVDPSITTPQQLIGKTVAVYTPAGSPSDYALINILAALGLNESQVQVSYLGNPNLDLTALLAGQVPAAVLSPPRNIEAANSGFKQMGPASTDTADAQPSLVLTTQTYLTNNPGIVTRYLQATLEAYRDLTILNATTAGTTIGNKTLASVSAFTGFNTTLTLQSLELYQSENLLDPTMLPHNSLWEASYNQTLAQNPSVANVNLTSVVDYSILNQLNSPCGFVYHLWGGSPPSAPS